METITIPKENFTKILADVEILIKDIETLSPVEEMVVKKRIADINTNPAIGKTEQELNEYLQQRGVKID